MLSVRCVTTVPEALTLSSRILWRFAGLVDLVVIVLFRIKSPNGVDGAVSGGVATVAQGTSRSQRQTALS